MYHASFMMLWDPKISSFVPFPLDCSGTHRQLCVSETVQAKEIKILKSLEGRIGAIT